MKHPWFVVKRYGFGATPSGWGWPVTLAFVALIGLAAIWTGRFGPVPTAIVVVALIAGFLVIVHWTGDHKPWRWRSGEEDPPSSP